MSATLVCVAVLAVSKMASPTKAPLKLTAVGAWLVWVLLLVPLDPSFLAAPMASRPAPNTAGNASSPSIAFSTTATSLTLAAGAAPASLKTTGMAMF